MLCFFHRIWRIIRLPVFNGFYFYNGFRIVRSCRNYNHISNCIIIAVSQIAVCSAILFKFHVAEDQVGFSAIGFFVKIRIKQFPGLIELHEFIYILDNTSPGSG